MDIFSFAVENNNTNEKQNNNVINLQNYFAFHLGGKFI